MFLKNVVCPPTKRVNAVFMTNWLFGSHPTSSPFKVLASSTAASTDGCPLPQRTPPKVASHFCYGHTTTISFSAVFVSSEYRSRTHARQTISLIGKSSHVHEKVSLAQNMTDPKVCNVVKTWTLVRTMVWTFGCESNQTSPISPHLNITQFTRSIRIRCTEMLKATV